MRIGQDDCMYAVNMFGFRDTDPLISINQHHDDVSLSLSGCLVSPFPMALERKGQKGVRKMIRLQSAMRNETEVAGATVSPSSLKLRSLKETEGEGHRGSRRCYNRGSVCVSTKHSCYYRNSI